MSHTFKALKIAQEAGITAYNHFVTEMSDKVKQHPSSETPAQLVYWEVFDKIIDPLWRHANMGFPLEEQ